MAVRIAAHSSVLHSQRLLGRLPLRAALVAVLLTVATGCERKAAVPAGPPRPVRTVTVEAFRAAPSAGFVGHIEAQDDAALSFRIAGRITDRLVGVGAELRGGQVVAQLDPENELNALRSTRAALAAAKGSCGRPRTSSSGWTI